jgi:hypothetical protein
MSGRSQLLGLSLIFLQFFLSAASAQEETEIRTLYQQANLKCASQEWGDAIPLFQKLLDKYPNSKYEDDAQFWIGYCLEKDPARKPQAFAAFSQVVTKFPDSPYADDAVGFQIDLAEQFVLAGKEDYRDFLHNELKKEMGNMQARAAIALGRIGDPAALPFLEKMVENEDYGKLARDLAALLQINRMPVEGPKQVVEEAEIQSAYEEKKDGIEKDKSFLWFGSARYEQYQSMLKVDVNWTGDELYDFALWHIVTTDEFKKYKGLPSVAGKTEWLRKYWKRNDPTPTSPENERETEFRRRVKYASENFSELWKSSEFKYMPDQFLRPDWPHAPWDARGELYIKYGEPDARSNQGWQMEAWTYYRYGVDFLVRSYMTNIYGKAILPGEMSMRRYQLYGQRGQTYPDPPPLSSVTQQNFGIWNSLESFMQANFIFKNEMRYEHDYQANPIRHIKLSLEKQAEGEKEGLVYHYRIPAGEFKMIPKSGAFEVRFREIYCILDEELHEVARHDLIRNINKIPDDNYLLEEKIRFNLPAGKYTFYLHLEDLNEKNLGVFSQQFEVSKI